MTLIYENDGIRSGKLSASIVTVLHETRIELRTSRFTVTLCADDAAMLRDALASAVSTETINIIGH